jgi:hypothetical protein
MLMAMQTCEEHSEDAKIKKRMSKTRGQNLSDDSYVDIKKVLRLQILPCTLASSSFSEIQEEARKLLLDESCSARKQEPITPWLRA